MKLVVFLVTLAVLFGVPGVALAATKAECVAAYDQGQQLRARGALREAREQFLVCADPACPNATRSDCTVWVGELDASVPTVAFAVTAEDGKDVTDVTVFVDGVKLVESLDGKALPFDPGKHTLRFERAGKTVTLELVVREGEKNRTVPVAFGGTTSLPKPAEEGGGTISPGVWVLGGVGVAGLGLFGVLGGVAIAERSDAQDTCAPSCTDAEVDGIRTKLIVADIGLGVGLAASAGAVILAIVDVTSGPDAPADPAAASAFRLEPLLGPLDGGAYVGAQGRF